MTRTVIHEPALPPGVLDAVARRLPAGGIDIAGVDVDVDVDVVPGGTERALPV